MNRDLVVSMLDRFCDLHNCNDCVFWGDGCMFENMSDAELLKAVSILLGIKSDTTNTHVEAEDIRKAEWYGTT